jgi:hypothetical protein
MLITNASNENYRATEIVEFYAKRIQIEETFRAIKSHQFGLSARYVQTLDVNRWAVLMLFKFYNINNILDNRGYRAP